MPGEWEKQKSVWLIWPYNENDWPKLFKRIPGVVGKISACLSINQNVNLIIRNLKDISRIIKTSNRPLIIFPQATRVLPSERPPFKKGSFRIYDEFKISCQPVAINSGYVWPKIGKKKMNKEITVSILEPIEPGLSKEEFTSELEKKIYSELDKLN